MKIPILHLEEGIHHFEERIKSGTLHFYRDDIYPNDLDIRVELNKFEKNITCNITVSTRSEHRCDRCLVRYHRDLLEEFDIFFHFAEQELEEDEENVVALSPDVKEIDVTPYIVETLILAIPMKQLCRENCQGICAGCGVDLNQEKSVCPEAPPDQRWEKLKLLRK